LAIPGVGRGWGRGSGSSFKERPEKLIGVRECGEKRGGGITGNGLK